MARQAVMSIDLERFSDIPACRNVELPEMDEDVAVAGFDWLQARLEAADVSTTFFVVSDFAESIPHRIEELAATGHEIASHTCTHRHLTDLDRADRLVELEQSRDVLERLSGHPVTGFRAPSFDIPRDHFDAIARAGYTYDSSVLPSRSIPGWYGGQFETVKPTRVRELVGSADPPNDLVEVPVAIWPLLKLPLSGAWLRFFGVNYTLSGMRRLSNRGITPVLYIHPWELANPPQAAGVNRRVYWRTGEYTRRAVERLLESTFEFVPIRDALADDVGETP